MSLAEEPLVLVVDDEPAIQRLIAVELSTQGFRVATTGDGEEALRILDEEHPDLVILDIVMPGTSGLQVLPRIKEQHRVPVVLLTAKSSDSDKVRGLDQGADDYLAKPFSPEELTARVRALLRRSMTPDKAEKVRAGNVEIDLDTRLVTKNGERVVLTSAEWKLLNYLAANVDHLVLTPEALGKVWGSEYVGDVQYLRVWISRLRAKIEDDPANPTIIRTMPGKGYMLVSDLARESKRGDNLLPA